MEPWLDVAEVNHVGAHPRVTPEAGDHSLLLKVSSPLPRVLLVSHSGQ